MNVTEQDLENYINVFHSVLSETANEYIPAKHLQNILHLSLLPALIMGYVSTQFGVAIEYEPSENTSIHIRRGSARVEELLVQAPKAIRKTGPLVTIGGENIRFYNTPFSGRFPFRLITKEASAYFSEARFSAGQWERNIFYAEVFGNRSLENWNSEKAISRAKDEVIAALVDVQKADQKRLSISDYINTFKEKTVLLLGDYDKSGIARLERIENALKVMSYAVD